jgi:hypothetical protein
LEILLFISFFYKRRKDRFSGFENEIAQLQLIPHQKKIMQKRRTNSGILYNTLFFREMEASFKRNHRFQRQAGRLLFGGPNFRKLRTSRLNISKDKTIFNSQQ